MTRESPFCKRDEIADSPTHLSRASWRDVGSSFRARMMNRHRISHGTIARPLRPSPESGFLLMAEARLQRVGSLPSVIAFVAQATHPAGALLRDRQPAA